MATFVENQWMHTIICGKCGVLFAMSDAYITARRNDGKTFYCPNGDPRAYHETENDRLRKQLERKNEILHSTELRAEKAEQNLSQVTRAHRKMRERVMNGVCPCCNRSFGNLREHMKSEHPDFGSARTLLALRNAFGMTQAAVAREAGVHQTSVSLYERGKHVAAREQERIDHWLARQENSNA
ncbi:hypothetical protein C1M51_02945 [Methylibium sp. Pch-M]|uniref:helix-turn-helix domain-containing protein n=1 Tax=Methylibium sp. Pch-M TaxID=2082386 RepID=UPI0010128327|nr:helix-turn-helix transcriptional regulator [Methylibium sp. Pch-M]QAZ38462.1 hypothetical protein C1M51_02945 [Methylibium sp. Pch-M]